jgi:hypothetical protein
MSDNQKSTSTGISISTVLFLIFLVLKLAEIGQVATWSWWWVTAPLWIPVVVVVSVLLIAAIIVIIANNSK